jgi:hypothetical protein
VRVQHEHRRISLDVVALHDLRALILLRVDLDGEVAGLDRRHDPRQREHLLIELMAGVAPISADVEDHLLARRRRRRQRRRQRALEPPDRRPVRRIDVFWDMFDRRRRGAAGEPEGEPAGEGGGEARHGPRISRVAEARKIIAQLPPPPRGQGLAQTTRMDTMPDASPPRPPSRKRYGRFQP